MIIWLRSEDLNHLKELYIFSTPPYPIFNIRWGPIDSIIVVNITPPNTIYEWKLEPLKSLSFSIFTPVPPISFKVNSNTNIKLTLHPKQIYVPVYVWFKGGNLECLNVTQWKGKTLSQTWVQAKLLKILLHFRIL